MKIRRTSDSRISFELLNEDLSALNVRTDLINPENEKTKELLYSIIKKVYPKSIYDLDSGSKIIMDSSVNNKADGKLNLTLLKESKISKSRLRLSSLIFEFNSIDSLLDAAFSSNGEILLKKSSLYEKDGIYRLIVFPEGDEKVCLILNEYCDKILSGDISYFYTLEHFKLICKDYALSSLCLRYIY